MKRNILLLTGITMLLSFCQTSQQPSPEELIRISYQSEATGEERDYFLYLPKGYHSEPDKEWPVILFLHGNGERGNAKDELDYVISHGPMYEAWIQKRDLPFIIIHPQLPMYDRDEYDEYLRDRQPENIPVRLDEGTPDRMQDFETPQPMSGYVENPEIPLPPEGPPNGWYRLEQDLLDILDHTSATLQTDPAKVYLTGLSYGGFGTWYIASKHPDRFAAIVPVVGFGHPDLMEPIAESQMGVWCFSGGRDYIVHPQYFYTGLNKLEELGHKNVMYTIHADMGHDAWTRVYKSEELYQWMLKH